MVLARERFGHDAVRAQLDLPDFFENFSRYHALAKMFNGGKLNSMSSETIFKEARALPFAEQIELCRNLWDGIVGSHELTPGEAELIDRRLQDHLENPDDVVSLAEVKAKLDAKYRK
jgi:putative addiction module component (TIGR02574 family)